MYLPGWPAKLKFLQYIFFKLRALLQFSLSASAIAYTAYSKAFCFQGFILIFSLFDNLSLNADYRTPKEVSEEMILKKIA